MIGRLARRALASRGLELHKPNPLEHAAIEPEFDDLYARCAPYTMTSLERMYALYKAVGHVVEAGVPGDVVECGVWRGGSSMLVALTLAARGETDRAVWLYDTFEGMPEPTDADRLDDGTSAAAISAELGSDGEAGWCHAPLEEVARNMAATGLADERIRLVAGKVEDTIPATAPGRIAVLRLDTDWYESTRHELVHLYPLLSPGGVLIVDDYGHWEGARKAVDEYFAETGQHILLNRVDYTGRVGVKTA